MIDTDAQIELAAYHFWVEEMTVFLATEQILSVDWVQRRIEYLRDMDAAPYAFQAKLKPQQMREHQDRAFPIYQAVGNRILSRVLATRD